MPKKWTHADLADEVRRVLDDGSRWRKFGIADRQLNAVLADAITQRLYRLTYGGWPKDSANGTVSFND